MSDQGQKFRAVIARIWKEEDFKQKFLADTKGTLAEAGISFPANVSLKAHFNTADTIHIVIPANPAESELLDETLSAVSGGTASVGCITEDTTCYSICLSC
jgi:Nitrile hydratase, alpha chain